MGSAFRRLWQRYLRSNSYGDVVLRVVLSVAVWLVVGTLLSLSVPALLVSSLIPALGLLLSGVDRVQRRRTNG